MGEEMTEEQKVAIIYVRVATAMIRAMGMQAENDQRKHLGESMAYTEADFNRVIVEEGINWNAIHGLLYS